MKCSKHNAEATAICAYCGRAMCEQCAATPTASRMVCSANCAESLAREERAMQLLLQKSVQTLKASAFYCYLCSALSAAAAVFAWFMLPSPFLIWFTGGCALVLFVCGIWYGKMAMKSV